MVKLTYCIRRKPGLTRDEFIHYWAKVHGPIGARIPGLRRLVQSYAIAVPGDARPADFDGTAELWFDDLATLLRARQSAEWAAASADEANFIDRVGTAYLVSEERQIVQRAEDITMASTGKRPLVLGLWGVRYQVKDVQRSIAFYTHELGFKLDQQNLPAFGQVSLGELKLILSGPGASGSRPMPDGGQQEPGGWNRVVLEVRDLPARIRELKDRAVRLRNEMEVGPGGKQIQVEDPDGNPIELFEPAGR